MIEFKPIQKIQEEYLYLLKRNLNLLKQATNKEKQYYCFFEEISLFWLKKNEIIHFFLDKIELQDKCSFLAGAMYVDIENNGHYEFAPCGKIHIINDPITKLRVFYIKNLDINRQRINEYFNKVITDAINILQKYPGTFIYLPLDEVFSEAQEDKEDFLKETSFWLISNLFNDPCKTEHEFLNKYQSIGEIEKDINPELRNMLIFTDADDKSLSLKDRIERNITASNIFTSSLRRKMSEAEIFIMVTGQYFMQILDIIAVTFSYTLIPFIRSEIVFNYLLMTYSLFEDNKSTIELLEQTLVAFIFTRIYRNYNFSRVDFNVFLDHVSDNKLIDSIILKSRLKVDTVFNLQPKELTSLLNNECESFLPTY